ncbi:MAG: tetratricopeptide repeat protein, partial [Gemmataceae bacterium]|nr:tetratricopeptide repeat protein [Gemmataceae bacterium]
LCYLEGKTNEEAARDLNCPIGTIMSRLGRAREKLRKRLSRRGVALSAAVAGGALTTQALAAPVSETQLVQVAQAAQQLSSGAVTSAATPLRWSDTMARGMTEFPLRGMLAGMATVAILAIVTFVGADFLLAPADKYSDSANIRIKPGTGHDGLCQADGPAFALDGPRLALLDTLDTRELATQALVLSTDGNTLATGNRDGSVLLWETWSRQMLAELPIGAAVTCLQFSKNAGTLLVGCQTGVIQLWDCNQRKKLWQIQAHDDAVLSLAACPERNYAASSGADDEVRLWRYTDGEATGSMTGVGDFPRLAFAPDGTHLFTAGASGKILAWDVDNWRHNGMWADQKQCVAQLVFSRDGKYLATVQDNGDIHVWDGQTRALRQRLKSASAASFAAFSADGSVLAAGGPRHSIRTWDVASVEKHHPESPIILETLARAYMHHLRYKEALACITRWIEDTPETAKPYQWRGWVFERLNHSKKAMEDYQTALKLDAGMSSVRLRIAEMHLEDSDPLAAIPHLEHLREQLPERPEPVARLGQCRFLQGRHEEARRLLEEAVKEMPKDLNVLVYLGKLELQQERPAAAEQWLRRALKVDDKDTEALYTLVSVLQLQGRAEEADLTLAKYKHFKELVERANRLLREETDRASNHPAVASEIGSLLLQIGRENLGLYWLGRALERDPQHQPSHKALADHYESKGEHDKAASHRRKLQSIKEKPAVSSAASGH